MDPGNHLATKLLQSLAVFYDRPGVEEIVVNRPGEVWIKAQAVAQNDGSLRGQPWRLEDAPAITYEYLVRVCKVLANINSTKFSERDLPIVSCPIPGKNLRFQAILGTNVSYEHGELRGAGIAIRSLLADTRIKLPTYFPDATLVGSAPPPNEISEMGVGDDHIERIRAIIAGHESVIVAGATSAGKTTFANKILLMVPSDERVITVEDTRELTIPNSNRLHLTIARNRGVNSVDYSAIVNALMRLTPDWIVCGELSVENALPLFNLMGKGHPIITTVHAGTPDEAVAAFVNNMAMSAAGGLDPQRTAEQLGRQIGCIIQLQRRDGQRKVVEIRYPKRDAAERDARKRGDA